MDAVIGKLLRTFDNASAELKHLVIGNDGYTPVPFSLANYKPPVPKEALIAFIDSGNAELASGPNFSLHYIRTCAIIRGKQPIIEEAYCLVQAAEKDGKLAYTTDLIGIEGIRLPTIDLYEQSLAEGTHRVQPAKVAELARTLAELRLASWVVPELPNGGFLVRDGDLQAHTIYEQTALRELYERARIQGITIAGLSKTSTLLTNAGHAAIPALVEHAPIASWYYHPIASSTRADHQASVAVTKLHPLSRYAFRIDVHDQHEPFLPELLNALAFDSTDAAFLGYPYGLTQADRHAKVREDERAYLRLKATIALGEKLAHHEAALDAHDTLNKAT